MISGTWAAYFHDVLVFAIRKITIRYSTTQKTTRT
ncbi:hypothetical protein DEDE109153_15655 [Deinococcus deserti]